MGGATMGPTPVPESGSFLISFGGGQNGLFCGVTVGPILYLHPFAFLQGFIVLEEVFDLINQ